MVKKEVQKSSKKKCYYCSKLVDTSKDHYVQLSTYNRSNSPDDHNYFHFQCFCNYFNKCVEKKMMANMNLIQNKAREVLVHPMIRGMLIKLNGAEALNLVSPVKQDNFFQKAINSLHTKNDRKKRRTKKGKT